jgi:protein TonB
MRKILTLAVALLAGCAQHSAPLSMHARADAPDQAAPARITHLTRLGCIYLRERLGLPGLGSPPPMPPGMSDAQPSSPSSPSRAVAEKYLAAHTNCARQPLPGARPGARRPHPPEYTPPRLAAARPAVASYYPTAAQRLGVEGTAVVRVCVGPHGHVTAASISRSSGSAALDRAAVRYARATSGHWRPATRAGHAVNGCTSLPVRFSMLSF